MFRSQAGTILGIVALSLMAGVLGGKWFQQPSATQPSAEAVVRVGDLNADRAAMRRGSGPSAELIAESFGPISAADHDDTEEIRYFPEVLTTDAQQPQSSATAPGKPVPPFPAEEQALWREQLNHLPQEQVEEILRVRKALGPGLARTLDVEPVKPAGTPPNLFPVSAESDVKPISAERVAAASSTSTKADEAFEQLEEQIETVRLFNLSHQSSPGFRRQEVQLPGGLSAEPLQWLVRLDLRPGRMVETQNRLDVAILNSGWFAVRDGDTIRFTRCGLLATTPDHKLGVRTGRGLLPLEPPVTLPEKGLQQLRIQPDGACLATMEGSAEAKNCGRIVLSDFTDPSALKLLPEGLYEATNGSGSAFALPSTDSTPAFQIGALEESNATLDKEAAHDRLLRQLSDGVSASVNAVTHP